MDVSSSFDALRYEIVEAQKARTDLMKYKLVVTAILGAVAVGIGPASGAKQIPYVIGIIPPVSLYVDAVCHHNDIRMLVIGRYMRSEGFVYESLAEYLRGMFSLERVALDLSSFFFSAFILVFGLANLLVNRGDADLMLIAIAIGSGTFGLCATWWVHRAHRRAMARISTMELTEVHRATSRR